MGARGLTTITICAASAALMVGCGGTTTHPTAHAPAGPTTPLSQARAVFTHNVRAAPTMDPTTATMPKPPTGFTQRDIAPLERIAKSAAIRSFDPRLSAMSPTKAAAYVWAQAPAPTYRGLRDGLIRQLRPLGWQFLTANLANATPPAPRFIRFAWTANLIHSPGAAPFPEVEVEVDAVAVQVIDGLPVAVQRQVFVGSQHPRDPTWHPGANLDWQGFGENFCTAITTGQLAPSRTVVALRYDTRHLTGVLQPSKAGKQAKVTTKSSVQDWIRGCRGNPNYRPPN